MRIEPLLNLCFDCFIIFAGRVNKCYNRSARYIRGRKGEFMKLKKAAIWGIAVVLLAGGIAAGAVVLNGRSETKDNQAVQDLYHHIF